jgi:hypothetical protein
MNFNEVYSNSNLIKKFKQIMNNLDLFYENYSEYSLMISRERYLPFIWRSVKIIDDVYFIVWKFKSILIAVK